MTVRTGDRRHPKIPVEVEGDLYLTPWRSTDAVLDFLRRWGIPVESRKSLYRHIALGSLEATKIARSLMISSSSLGRWLEGASRC